MSICSYTINSIIKRVLVSRILHEEINGELGINPEHVNTKGIGIEIKFNVDLTPAQKTTLDTIIANHDPQDTSDNGGIGGGGGTGTGAGSGGGGSTDIFDNSFTFKYFDAYTTSTTLLPSVTSGSGSDSDDEGSGTSGSLDVPLNVVRHIDNVFTHVDNSAEITVGTFDVYEITWTVSLDNNTNTSRGTSHCQLYVDNGTGYTAVPGSSSYGYHRKESRFASHGRNVILRLNAGAKIKIVVRSIDISGKSNARLRLVNGGSGITVKKQTI